jgi:hypothetical protein
VLLGLGRRWAERKVEEEADCGHVREKKRIVGRLSARGKERERGRMGLREEGPAQGKERRQAGLPGLRSGLALLFPSLSFSNPFETQIYLNSNELLNSNPVHSFQ